MINNFFISIFFSISAGNSIPLSYQNLISEASLISFLSNKAWISFFIICSKVNPLTSTCVLLYLEYAILSSKSEFSRLFLLSIFNFLGFRNLFPYLFVKHRILTLLLIFYTLIVKKAKNISASGIIKIITSQQPKYNNLSIISVSSIL